ncbi:adenylate/guanylate cyclase domain-containing protein [soil metagenome]
MSTTAAGGQLDALLDRAVDAVNGGQLDVARRLADEVRALDGDTDDVETLLGGAADAGVLRRPTMMFCDLVGSTELSSRHDPERYRRIIGRYKETCREIIERSYGGRIMAVKGDGILALFGFPVAHEDDTRRAVDAGLDLLEAMRRLSARAEHEVGEPLSARVAVHRGLVYIDPAENDVYGLAVNVAARLHELAEPGTLVTSQPVLRVVADRFEVRAQTPQKVKGVDEPLASWRILGERRGDRAPRHGRARVGRTAELDRLRRAWRDGEPVLISGEAGIGKSHLAGLFAAEIATTGAAVLRVGGSPIHAAPLHPFRELLEQRCGIGRGSTGDDRLELLRAHLDDVRVDATLVPALAALLRVDPTAGYSRPPADGRKLHDEVTSAVVEYVVGSTPHDALLLAEDAQWYDEATLEVVTRIVATRAPGLRLVLTSRVDAVPGVEAAGVALSPLDAEESGALIDALDRDGVTASFRAELVVRGAGIPLYLGELVRAAIEARSADAADADERLGDRGRTPTGIPEVLYEPLAARLDAIEGAGEIVAAAAAFGGVFDLDLLADVVSVASDDVRPVVAALVASGTFEPVSGSADCYRFHHDLIREAAEELQPPSARQLLHGRVADVVRRAAADDTAVDWLALARHYEIAQRLTDALACYERAADDARRIGALAVTSARLDRAIELVRSLADEHARTSREIELRLGRAFLAVSVEGNASASAVTDYERCLELALGSASSEEVLRTLIPLWAYYAARGELARAGELTVVLERVVLDGREWFRSENTAAFGMLDWFGGRFIDARRRLEESAAAVSSHAPDQRVAVRWFVPNDPTASIHTHLGLARLVHGDNVGAAKAFDAADLVAAELPFPQGAYSAAYNSTYRSWALTHLGAFDEAAAAADHSLRLGEEHGFDFWVIAASTQRLVNDVHRAWDEPAIERAELAALAVQLDGFVGMWKLMDVQVLLPSILTAVALAHGGAGDADAAHDRLDEAAALAARTGVRFYDAGIRRAAALLEPDPVRAALILEEADSIARAQGAAMFRSRIADDLSRLRANAAVG